jgi:hypothetical protein
MKSCPGRVSSGTNHRTAFDGAGPSGFISLSANELRSGDHRRRSSYPSALPLSKLVPDRRLLDRANVGGKRAISPVLSQLSANSLEIADVGQDAIFGFGDKAFCRALTDCGVVSSTQPFFGKVEKPPISDASLSAGKSYVFRHAFARAGFSYVLTESSSTRRERAKGPAGTRRKSNVFRA